MGNRRLSELPEDIIHRIITNHLLCGPNITNKTVVRFSLLSQDLWRAVQRRPVLVFEWDEDSRSKDRCLQELRHMVSVLNQNTHLETFTVRAPTFRFISDSVFDQCIELAAANSRVLRNLNLRMWDTYVVPKAVFKVESLVQLDLESCSLQEVESVITWTSLKSLCLYHVNIGEGTFENIIRGCPLIEVLEIRFSFFNVSDFHIVKVFNLGCLKQLDITLADSQTFEVDATPNLECLACNYVPGYPNPSDDFFTKVERQFPRLEELSIHDIVNPNIKRISLSSSSLKKMKLHYIRGGLEEATFDVPNILVFKYESDVAPKLSFAGNSSGWISRIKFRIYNGNIDSSWILKLKDFLAVAISSVLETSISVSFMDAFIEFVIEAHPRISADSVSFPETVQKLTVSRSTLYTYAEQQAFSLPFASEIMDGMLLICRPQRIILEGWHDSEFLNLIYDNLILMEFNDPNIQHLMWNVSEIQVHRCETWDQLALNQPQVLASDQFLALLKVGHHYWKAIRNIIFDMEYYLRPEQQMITSDAADISNVKQSRLVQVKDSKEVIFPNKTNERHCRILNSMKKGRSRKFHGCFFPSVKRLLFR